MDTFAYRDGEPQTEDECIELYREDLDGTYGEVGLAGCRYSVARTFEAADPNAFRQGFLEWFDALCRDGEMVAADGI